MRATRRGLFGMLAGALGLYKAASKRVSVLLAVRFRDPAAGGGWVYQRIVKDAAPDGRPWTREDVESSQFGIERIDV